MVSSVRDSDVRDGFFFYPSLSHTSYLCRTVERATRLTGPDRVVSTDAFMLRSLFCDDLGISSTNTERIRHDSTT